VGLLDDMHTFEKNSRLCSQLIDVASEFLDAYNGELIREDSGKDSGATIQT
jgi:hypothetical protein